MKMYFDAFSFHIDFIMTVSMTLTFKLNLEIVLLWMIHPYTFSFLHENITQSAGEMLDFLCGFFQS